MKMYTLEQFCKKYEGKRGICCGINYVDGSHETVMNGTVSIVLFAIRKNGNEVAFIASR